MHTSQAQPETLHNQSVKRDGVIDDAQAGLEGWLLALGGRTRLMAVSRGLVVGLMVWLLVALAALILDRWLAYTPVIWWLIDGVLFFGFLAGLVVACWWVRRLTPSLVSAAQLARQRGVDGIVPIAAEYLASPVTSGSAGLWGETVRRAAVAVETVPVTTLVSTQAVKRGAVYLFVCATLSGGLISTGLRVPLKRMLNPGADFAPHTGLRFQITQSPDPVLIGERVVVSADVAWQSPSDAVDAATLVFDDGQVVRRVAMRSVAIVKPEENDEQGKQFAARFTADLNQTVSGVGTEGRYRIETARGRTDWQAWRVDRSPRLSRMIASWQPPIYTGLAEGRKALSSGGRLHVPEGSILELTGIANRSIERVELNTSTAPVIAGAVEEAAVNLQTIATEGGVWRVEAHAESLVGAMSINVSVILDRAPELKAGFAATAQGPVLVSEATDDYGLSGGGAWELMTVRDDAPVRVAEGEWSGSDEQRSAQWQAPVAEAAEHAGLAAGQIVWAEVWVADNKTPQGQTTRVRTPPMVLQQKAAGDTAVQGVGLGGGDGEQSTGGMDSQGSDSGGADLSLTPLSEAIDESLDTQANQAQSSSQSKGASNKTSSGAPGSEASTDQASQGSAPGSPGGPGTRGTSQTPGSVPFGGFGGGALVGQAVAAGFLSEEQADSFAEQWDAVLDAPLAEREAMREALVEQTRKAIADELLQGAAEGDVAEQSVEDQSPGDPIWGYQMGSGGPMLDAEGLSGDPVIAAERGVLSLGARRSASVEDAQSLRAALEGLESGRSGVPTVYRKRVRSYLRALAEEESGSVDRNDG